MPLGKRTDYGDARYAGVEVNFSPSLQQTAEEHYLCGFDFVVADLVDPERKRGLAKPVSDGLLPVPFDYQDVLFVSTQFCGQVVGRTSAWIDPDADDEDLRAESAAALLNELSWAAHLGVQAVVVPCPRQNNRRSHANLARIINQVMSGLSSMAIWLELPYDNRKAALDTAESSPQDGLADSWDVWSRICTLCEGSALLGSFLDLGSQVPPPAALHRWLAGPLRAVRLSTSVFGSNKRGYPVLARTHQELIARCFAHNVQVVLTGPALHAVAPPPLPPATPPHPPGMGSVVVTHPGELHPLRPYWEYLCYQFRKMEQLSSEEMTELNYRDYLQAPLQPLQDNLESATYETFERDGVKYEQYERAVHAALLDRVPESEAESRRVVVMVVGAGRGPLVRASLQAAQRARRRVHVFAVEKNPNAVLHIQQLIRKQQWEDQVTLVSADMRWWQAPEPADILVSELLGSFGDNELSPECLDGAQRFLKSDGISIPCSYTSWMAPVSASKLHNDVKGYKDLKHLETPYVVKFFRHCLLGPPQKVFSFSHPNRSPIIDNSRFTMLKFERSGETAGIVHGFAGFFDTVLYGNVTLSTHPDTHTPNMFSWFPIYFPLREPVYVPAGQDICAHMWRCVAAHKVWYEWALTEPSVTPLHNPSGRSYWVGL